MFTHDYFLSCVLFLQKLCVLFECWTRSGNICQDFGSIILHFLYFYKFQFGPILYNSNWEEASTFGCAADWICKSLGFQHSAMHMMYSNQFEQLGFKLKNIVCQDFFLGANVPFKMKKEEISSFGSDILVTYCGPYKGTSVLRNGILFKFVILT